MNAARPGEPGRPAGPGRVLLDALPLAIAVTALMLWLTQRSPAPTVTASADVAALEPVTFESAAKLETLFERHGYTWPPRGGVPALALRALPGDLAALPVPRKKSLFFRALLPLVLAENRRIARQRERLIGTDRQVLQAGEGGQRRWLERLAARYGVEGDPADPAVRQRLRRRVDTIPPALVLAQAANESGWGTSRFAQQANNLFGEWTWSERNGLAPSQRPEDADYYVRVFPDLRSSVRSYLENLNTGHAYRRLRGLRAAARAAGETPRAVVLAAGLHRYSSRGEAYVEEIRALIRQNDLRRAVAGVDLVPSSQLAAAAP